MSRPGFVTWAGLALVWGAAAVLSFTSLRDLAESCRVPGQLAWLLPIVIDAGAAVGTRAWLSRRANPDAEQFACAMTWTLLVLTVALNAGHQGMVAYQLTPPWPVAVLVGAIPPAVVGATVHLAVLLGRADTSSGLPNVEVPQVTATAEVVPTTREVADNRAADDLAKRVIARIEAAKAAGEPVPGRRRLAQVLEVKEHEVRTVLETVKTVRAQ